MPYLFEGVSKLDVGDLLRVLELEEAVPAVARHVDQNVGSGISHQSFGPENRMEDMTRVSNSRGVFFWG